jgi:AcrR family transcriptional regulator/DNA-binding transcriptional regulator YhcF (GntR family)
MTAHPTAPYLRIADDIEHRINAGELRQGDRVPSIRQITRDWGVAIATATRALGELAARGAVQAVPGVGTVVADTAAGTGRSGRRPPARAERPRPAPSPVAAPAPGRPAPGRTVSTARIIETAIAIADAEGIAAVSMRRVAVELGVATMSLYRWIPSKEALVAAMMDRLMGDGDWPAVPPPGWRAQLEYVARRQWRGYQAHPWLAQVVSLTRPQLAPRAMRHTEWALRAIDGFGLDPTTRLYLVLTLFGHVKAAATGLDTERQAERDTGLDIDEWMRDHDPRFRPVIQSGRFPHLAKLDGNAEIDFDLTALFEFGLKNLLDGFSNLLKNAPRRTSNAPTRITSTGPVRRAGVPGAG